MYAITANGFRSIETLAQLQAGESAADEVPDEVLLAIRCTDCRSLRDALLRASDWTQLPDTPLTAELKVAWASYRQLLRDVPNQRGFPDAVEWPEWPVANNP